MRLGARRIRSDIVDQLLTAIILISALILIHASVEAGMNDDWSYVRTVQQLAATGHLRYNGWSAPLIGFQAYWAALFVRVFGFSFFVVRASSYTLTLLSIPILWNILVLAGLTRLQIFFALTAFLLSPLLLPNLATFMTDVPAFLLFAAALFCYLKSWHSAKDRTALSWVLAGTLFALLSGSIRQFYWLASLCFPAVLAVFRFRTIRKRIILALWALVTIATAMLCEHWLSLQPLVPADAASPSLASYANLSLIADALELFLRSLIGLALLSLPFTAPLAWINFRKVPRLLQIVIAAASIWTSFHFANPVPWVGNTVSEFGVLRTGTVALGWKPQILTMPIAAGLAATGLICGIYALCSLPDFKFSLESPLSRFVALTIPFLLLYEFTVSIRAALYSRYDRYLIPELFVVLTLALAAYAKEKAKLSPAHWFLAGLFSAYALATTHDYFAEARARLKATEEVLRAGHARAEIISGFEFDCWTQVEKVGFINNDLLKNPKGAYVQSDDCNGPDDADAWWRNLAPGIQARYVVTLSPIEGLVPADYPPVNFHRWLPFGTYQVLIEKVRDTDPPLMCVPDTGS